MATHGLDGPDAYRHTLIPSYAVPGCGPAATVQFYQPMAGQLPITISKLMCP